jgi:3-hydroxyacyl-[acyl-carrier-protein] dehydratase
MTDTLYSISIDQFSDHAVEASVILAGSHPLYNGHFPDAPVLPGVIQLQIVKEVMQKHFGRKFRLKGVRTCKFLGMINPLTVNGLSVSIRWQVAENLEVIASIQSDIVFMKAQLSYVLEDQPAGLNIPKGVNSNKE